MLILLQQGQYLLFAMLIIALIISLTFHEFGHAAVAKAFGDNTAERAGRLTLNPIAHIDLFGLLLVMVVGFGYAKPVPTNPRNFTAPSADLWVAAAGPFMNLLLAILVWNLYLGMVAAGNPFFAGQQVFVFCLLLAQINLLLMIFNLIPIAPLDGHYILPYFLPDKAASESEQLQSPCRPLPALVACGSEPHGHPNLLFAVKLRAHALAAY